MAELPAKAEQNEDNTLEQGTDIYYHLDLIFLQVNGSPYTFGWNSSCHFGHWPFKISQ